MAYRAVLGSALLLVQKATSRSFNRPGIASDKVRQGGRSRPGEAGMRRLKWAAVTTTVAALGIAAPGSRGDTRSAADHLHRPADPGLNGPDRVAAQTFAAGLTGGLTGRSAHRLRGGFGNPGPLLVHDPNRRQRIAVRDGARKRRLPPVPRSIMRWGPRRISSPSRLPRPLR